jgi:Universal stress protein UspA and related nucleotide-binding proteins
MTTVLVPLDADEGRTQRQVDALTALSLGVDVEVLLLHVYEPVDAPGMDMAGSSIADINDALEELQGLPAGLADADAHLQDAGFRTRLVTAVGETAAEIVASASQEEADIIVLATRRQSPVGKALFGSVAQSVILDTDVPVLVV